MSCILSGAVACRLVKIFEAVHVMCVSLRKICACEFFIPQMAVDEPHLMQNMNMSQQAIACPLFHTSFTCSSLLLQLALDEAQELMDIAAAGEGGYEGIRQQLAEAYQKAGLADVANFIRAA
jgi:hypothetical protein